MTPKTIHLCWFSKDPFPVEIKVCLDTWKKLLPDYTVKRWTYDDAMATGIDFIREALEERQWAFAADALRFYAVYTEGGVYMDSDIFLYRRFDKFMANDCCTTFMTEEGATRTGIQAAFFIAPKGDAFCGEMTNYYRTHHFRQPDGSLDRTISPILMEQIATRRGFDINNRQTQHVDGLNVYSTDYLLPRKRYPRTPLTFGEHRIYGSWRKRKLSRKIDLKVNHYINVVRYALLRR